MKWNAGNFVIGLLIGIIIGGTIGWYIVPKNPPPSASLKTAGSTTVYPLSVAWSTRYYDYTLTQGASVKLEVSSGGSGYGRTSAVAGTVDFGAASSYKAPTDYGADSDDQIKTIPIAADALAVVVNPIVNASGMSLKREHIVAIFNGSITTWPSLVSAFTDIHSVDATGTIQVYHRSEASGTTATFTAWLDKDPNWPLGDDEIISWPAQDNFHGAEGNPGVQQGVTADANGIGYVGFAFTTGLTPVTLYNPGNGQWVQASPENAKLAIPDPLPNASVTLFDSTTSGAYPIARLIFYLVNVDPPATSYVTLQYGVKLRQETKDFLQWALNPVGGQQESIIRQEVGYLELTGTGALTYSQGIINALTPGVMLGPLFQPIAFFTKIDA